MIKQYILASLNILIFLIATFIYSLGLFTIGINENTKSISITILLALLLILSIKLYFSKKTTLYNIGTFLTFILNVTLIYNIYNLNNEYKYIENLFNKQYQYTTYNVYVLKSTPTYNNLQSLSNKKIGSLNNNTTNIKEYLKENSNIEYIQYNSIYELEYAIQNGEIQSIILSQKQYDNLNKEKTDIKKEIRSIYQTKIKNTI